MATTELKVNMADVEVTKEVDGNLGKIKLPESTYVEVAKANGIEKSTLEKIEKFDEAFMKAAVEKAVEEAGTLFKENKDIKEIEVSSPFGTTKSQKIDTYIQREREFKNPGNGQVVKKSVIKITESKRYTFPKSKRKELENKLHDLISG